MTGTPGSVCEIRFLGRVAHIHGIPRDTGVLAVRAVLGSYMSVSTTATTMPDVVVHQALTSSAELDRLEKEISRRDGRYVALERRRTGMLTESDGGNRWLVDSEGRFAYLSVPVQSTVTVFGCHAAELLWETIRLTRTLLVSTLVAVDGFVPVHASAVELDGRAVIFTGRSGSGKSTLAVGAVKYLGANLIANDLVLLGLHGGDLVVAGIPLQVRLAAGTVQSLELLDRIDPYTDFAPFVDAADWSERSKKIEVSPETLMSWFGRRVRPMAELGTIIFARLADGPDVTVKDIPAASISERLEATITRYDPAWPSWTGIGYDSPAPLNDAHCRTVNRIASTPALELFGARAADLALCVLADRLAQQRDLFSRLHNILAALRRAHPIRPSP